MNLIFRKFWKAVEGTRVPMPVSCLAAAFRNLSGSLFFGRAGNGISRSVRLFPFIDGVLAGCGWKKAVLPLALILLVLGVVLAFSPDASADVIRIENTAIATFNNGPAVASNTVINTSADDSSDPAVEKMVDRASPKPGETVTYTVLATNRGGAEAHGVQVTDELPSGLTLLSAEADRGRFQEGIWTIGLLNAGEKAMLSVRAVVNADAAGARITNTAVIISDGADADSGNNISHVDITVQTATARTPSVIELLKYAPDLGTAEQVAVAVTDRSENCGTDGPFSPLPLPVTVGSGVPISLSTNVPLIPSDLYHQGEPFFIRLTDHDQNLDAGLRETVLVRLSSTDTRDAETLRLMETGPDTGVFTGYIQSSGISSQQCDGRLSVTADSEVEARYEDMADHTDVSVMAVMVDPYGKVFDTGTGLPLNGARVTLIDAATGNPAMVYGDDGVSRFPATVISGGRTAGGLTSGVIRDSSGNVYDLPEGGFRFPVVPPGRYRLDVSPPDGYKAPTIQSTDRLQSLPGAPFAIAEPGSRGEVFSLNPGPAFQIDIPVDPLADSLFLVKTARRQSAGVGDFIPYDLELKNNADQAVTRAVIADTLPLGLDYQNGSLTINGQQAPDPDITNKGRTLEISVGDLASGGSAAVGYVVEVAAGAKKGRAVNQAVARGEGGVASQPATAAVEIREDLFRSRSFLMGRVIIDNGEDKKNNDGDGLEGVKIYLEDGTYVVSDPEGKFHFEGVTPGVHVVQMDLGTLPEKFEPVDCDKKGRFAGRAYSQFVDIQGGSLWQTDFHVRLKSRAVGGLRLSLASDLKTDGLVTGRAMMAAETVPVRNIRFTVMLPETLVYVPGTSRVDGRPVPDPGLNGGVMTYRVGDAGQGRPRRVEFDMRPSGTAAGDFKIQGLATFNTPERNNQRTPAVENGIRLSGSTGPEKIKLLKRQAETRAETIGLRPGEIWKEPEAKTEKIGFNTYDQQYVESATPGIAWLWPENASVPSIPSVKVAIQHLPGQQLNLILNGKPVSPLNLDTVLINRAKTVAVTRWRGVDVQDGDNRFEAVIRDKQGREVSRLERMVHYSDAPVRAKLVREASVLVADGKTVPVIAVQFTDKAGYPAREGVVGEFILKAPYLSEQEKRDLKSDPLSGRTEKALRFEIGEKGIAKIRLQPTTVTGTAELEFPFLNGSQSIRAWLAPEKREWILVGMAEGTMGYNVVSGNMESLSAADMAEHIYEDGRMAFFAKGRIKGEWLMTLAYDTTQEKAAGEGLHRTIDPDTYYTLYGDAAEQAYDAASTRRLYVKMEKDQFYALFGDYDTGMTVTELSRYDRSLNGFKTELQTDRYSVNVFATDSGQLFIKDEIRGDGTSGLYRLSHPSIVINSEKIRIETRDRFKSEVIVKVQEMRRHLDYNIDYDSGVLYFKQPVYSKDEDFNPIFIVADYEVENATGENYFTYGGRGAVRFFDQALEVGATGIQEDNGTSNGRLGGVDATVKIGAGTEVKAEIAATRTDTVGQEDSGTAQMVELNHMTEQVEGKIYAREQDDGFGLGQQSVSESGTRKLGMEGSYHFTRQWSADAETYRQYNLTNDARRDVVEMSGDYTGEVYGMEAGLRHAEDRFSGPDAENQKADQIIAGVSRRFLDSRAQLRATQEQSIGRNNHEEFPTRTLFGGDYQLTDTARLFVEQEFTFSDTGDTQGARAGIDTTPWTGGRVSSSLGRDYQEDGARVYANMGLGQTWRINDRWSVDGGIDQSRTVSGEPAQDFDEDTAPAFGPSDDHDFTALSLGTLYRRELWSWDWRGEFRHSDNEDKQGLLTGVYGEPRPGVGLSAALEWFDTNATEGTDETSADLRFGMAYRPKNTFWMLLDRLDLIQEEAAETSGDSIRSRRVVNNLNLHVMPMDPWQISLQYGAKYVKDTIDDRDYLGYTDLTGLETRYNITRRWDVGLHGGILHSWKADQYDYTTGASVGCTLLTNAWASVGYNFTGFADRDFSIVNFTAKGPFIKLRIKVDQESAKDAVEWFTKR